MTIKNDNNYKNLYAGSQKDNIADCLRNNHRVGNKRYFVVREKTTNKILTFYPAYKFLDYAGHPQVNGGVSKVLNKKWFEKEYELISFEKGVTTIENTSKRKM